VSARLRYEGVALPEQPFPARRDASAFLESPETPQSATLMRTSSTRTRFITGAQPLDIGTRRSRC